MYGHQDSNAFAIHVPSDTARDSHLWRDSRIKEALSQELQKQGHFYSDLDPDVAIYLWGWIVKPIQPGCKNVLWVIGHPDLLQKHIEEIRMVQWSGVFCSSRSYCRKLEKQGIPAEWMVCPGADRPPFTHKPEYDLAFVGNSDPAKGREALVPVFNRYKSNVVGPFPGASMPEINWRGMQEVFNSGRIVPYTHHKDMAREGFVADAVLDVAKNSGALVLCDSNPGVYDLNIPFPLWSSPEELYDQINHYLENEDLRLELVTRCRVAASKYTMFDCAARMEKFF